MWRSYRWCDRARDAVPPSTAIGRETVSSSSGSSGLVVTLDTSSISWPSSNCCSPLKRHAAVYQSSSMWMHPSPNHTPASANKFMIFNGVCFAWGGYTVQVIRREMCSHMCARHLPDYVASFWARAVHACPECNRPWIMQCGVLTE